MAAGHAHTCAVKTDGTLICWIVEHNMTEASCMPRFKQICRSVASSDAEVVTTVAMDAILYRSHGCTRQYESGQCEVPADLGPMVAPPGCQGSGTDQVEVCERAIAGAES